MTFKQGFSSVWWGVASAVTMTVLLAGQNPQQAVTPNQAVEHADHTWQEGMFQTLMEASWPRYALLLIAIVLGIYFWRRRRGSRTP